MDINDIPAYYGAPGKTRYLLPLNSLNSPAIMPASKMEVVSIMYFNLAGLFAIYHDDSYWQLVLLYNLIIN